MTDPSSEAVVGTPAPQLRSVVSGYRGYRVVGSPAIHRGLPSSCLTFIISLDAPVDIVRMPDDIQAPGQFQAFVAGMHASPAYIRHDGYQHGISIDVTPFGARSLFGMPAGALAYSVVALEDVVGLASSRLADCLASSSGWRERFAALDEALLGCLRDGAGPVPEVAWAWHRLVATAGAVEVSALASEVGYSRRHLGELFRREFGLAPKSAARVLRFERSRHLLITRRRDGLASIATAAGYCDQAHMVREWKAMAGCPPTAWMAEELPFVQDEPVVLGAC